MELFSKIMNGWKPLTFSVKSSILDIMLGLEMPLDSQSLTIFTKNCVKVAGYMTLTGYVFLGNLWNFQNSFHKKHPWMPGSAISCHWKMFQPKYTYFSKNVSFDFSHLCFDIQWHLFPGIKCITDVQKSNIWIRCVVMF